MAEKNLQQQPVGTLKWESMVESNKNALDLLTAFVLQAA